MEVYVDVRSTQTLEIIIIIGVIPESHSNSTITIKEKACIDQMIALPGPSARKRMLSSETVSGGHNPTADFHPLRRPRLHRQHLGHAGHVLSPRPRRGPGTAAPRSARRQSQGPVHRLAGRPGDGGAGFGRRCHAVTAAGEGEGGRGMVRERETERETEARDERERGGGRGLRGEGREERM